MDPRNDESWDRTLRRLRGLVEVALERKGYPILSSGLVELAADIDIDARVTIDFAAAELLGAPMVVIERRQRSRTATWLELLSPREREVAALVAEGFTNAEIAERLHISVATAKDHVHNILRKSGHSSRSRIIAEHPDRSA